MKIFKRVLIIVILLTVAFFSIGLIFPSFKYGNEIVIARSPAECWEIYTDTAFMRQWIPGFESMTLTKGQWWKSGSDYQFIITDGERMEMKQTIVEISPASSITYVLTNDVLKSEYKVVFTGDSSNTNLSTHYEVTGNNVAMRSMLFLSQSYLKNTDHEMLINLKRIIEKMP